jgi:transcriptional regulator with XRE-family HTH domain
MSVPALLVHRLTEAHPCGDQSRATIVSMGNPFDLAAALRRIRRSADMSQRELAAVTGLAVSTLGHAEAGTRDLPVGSLVRAAAVAGLRLVLVDDTGQEVTGMSADAVRDMGGRRFPAHLDTRYSDDGWWHGPHRYDREAPWYTFDRDRSMRDRYRQQSGIPEDHQLPQPGDSPGDRAYVRQREHWRRRAEERERAFLAGELSGLDAGFTCCCLPACDDLDEQTGELLHAEACPCNCDLA